MAHPTPRSTRTGPWLLIAVLLAASLVGTLWVPFYARSTPSLGGFPFFYWYQLIWIPLVAILSWLAYMLTRIGRDGRSPAPAPPEDAAGPGSAEGGDLR